MSTEESDTEIRIDVVGHMSHDDEFVFYDAIHEAAKKAKVRVKFIQLREYTKTVTMGGR